MSEFIKVDRETYLKLEFAANISGITTGEVVSRLVSAASLPKLSGEETEHSEEDTDVAVYADYEGHRTYGRFDTKTNRIDIRSGPLAGQSHKTPTGAARAVIAHHNPHVSPNRNGWMFWMIDDGSGRFLQSIRPTT